MIYDYENNIKIEKNEKGEIVMTMNQPIFTELTNDIHEASEHQEEQGYKATAKFTRDLWKAIMDKSEKYYE